MPSTGVSLCNALFLERLANGVGDAMDLATMEPRRVNILETHRETINRSRNSQPLGHECIRSLFVAGEIALFDDRRGDDPPKYRWLNVSDSARECLHCAGAGGQEQTRKRQYRVASALYLALETGQDRGTRIADFLVLLGKKAVESRP